MRELDKYLILSSKVNFMGNVKFTKYFMYNFIEGQIIAEKISMEKKY